MNKKEAKRILHETLGNYADKGTELLFVCPACDHHKRKFSVNLIKNAFKCWVCDYRGRNLRRVVRRFGSYTQLQKWDQITGRTDLERYSDLFMEPVDEAGRQKIQLPKEFVSLCSNKIPATGTYALKYLQSRGVTTEEIVRWKIGYCFSGEYRNRIVIPSFDEDGDVNYFVARSFDNDWRKYLNPSLSRNIVFNELYIDWDSDIILVEGAFDAIKAGPNSIPLLGSTLREESSLFQEIVKNDACIYLALDPDAEKKTNKIISNLLQYGIELYHIDVTGFDDVGEMTKEEFLERKQNASFIGDNDYLFMKSLNL